MEAQYKHGSMTNKYSQTDSQVGALKNESARQRWELFHRAIAHAKQSNHSALQEADTGSAETKRTGRFLSIAR